jgi:hypothetical protein
MQHPSEPMSNLFVVSANRRYDECLYYKFANLIKIIACWEQRKAIKKIYIVMARAVFQVFETMVDMYHVYWFSHNSYYSLLDLKYINTGMRISPKYDTI